MDEQTKDIMVLVEGYFKKLTNSLAPHLPTSAINELHLANVWFNDELMRLNTRSVNDKLMGKGPVMTLSEKIWVNGYVGVTNLLPQGFENNVRAEEAIKVMLTEFLEHELTGCKVNGLFKLTSDMFDSVSILPDNALATPFDLQSLANLELMDSGFYDTSEGIVLVLHDTFGWHKNILRVCLGPSPFGADRYDRCLDMDILTWLNTEREWVQHDNFGVFGTCDSLRSKFKTVLKGRGYELPTKISKVKLKEVVNRTTDTIPKPINFEINAIKVNIETLEGNPEADSDVSFEYYPVIPLSNFNGEIAHDIAWEGLNPSTQKIIINFLEDVHKLHILTKS